MAYTERFVCEIAPMVLQIIESERFCSRRLSRRIGNERRRIAGYVINQQKWVVCSSYLEKHQNISRIPTNR
jgi:hypothetical protein